MGTHASVYFDALKLNDMRTAGGQGHSVSRLSIH